MKGQAGRDILVFGSGGLVTTLIQHGLVDEYWLLVFPVVVGRGRCLFPEETRATLQLAATRTFRSGVVALTNQPAAKGEALSWPEGYGAPRQGGGDRWAGTRGTDRAGDDGGGHHDDTGGSAGRAIRGGQ